ncbi:FliM/FliN family flagellar motor C-terminal domain-containing protein [Legionella fairfieldensis]|uniref:FliM/FliN family flagellar motor C-terminal domain-containing protein n=1 Tax=Legionella fairfieldensis TaxID=45064 RepID=UPI00049041ED|nr:FliM/FliN family flagellar motor C-terminal domain-containing protein [Legionella fairfieldensis]
MKTEFKPYRLINAKELANFREMFTPKICAWNQCYAIESFNFDIHCATVIRNSQEMLLLRAEENPLALLDKNYLSILKHSLFGDGADCFNEASRTIFMQLLNHLAVEEALESEDNATRDKEWIYPGSPCLCLRFNNNNGFFHLYFHPTWVLKHLSPMKAVTSIDSLDTALADKPIDLSVHLKPLRLEVNKLIHLEVGDVIKTDHQLDKPLLLQHQKQFVDKVHLGQWHDHKSIQLTRLL